MEIREIKLEDINDPPIQPRGQLEVAGIESLAQSIKEVGLIHPIVVRETNVGYELVAGTRRWHAYKLLGKETIPAQVIRKESRETTLLQFSENFHRHDLNPLETARMLKFLLEELGYSRAELAQLCGHDTSWVSRMLSLFDMPSYMQESIITGQLSHSVALELQRIKDDKIKQHYAEHAVSGGCTEKLARDWAKQATMVAAAIAAREEAKEPGKKETEVVITTSMSYDTCQICGAPGARVTLDPVYLCWHCQQKVLPNKNQAV